MDQPQHGRGGWLVDGIGHGDRGQSLGVLCAHRRSHQEDAVAGTSRDGDGRQLHGRRGVATGPRFEDVGAGCDSQVPAGGRVAETGHQGILVDEPDVTGRQVGRVLDEPDLGLLGHRRRRVGQHLQLERRQQVGGRERVAGAAFQADAAGVTGFVGGRVGAGVEEADVVRPGRDDDVVRDGTEGDARQTLHHRTVEVDIHR